MKNKTKQNQLIIGVKSEPDLFQEASALFEQLDKNKSAQSVNRLYFPTASYLWRQLSPQRLEALYALLQKGALSIRKLASELKRDYRGVHSDIQILLSLNLVEKQVNGLIHVPWNSIIIEISCSAVA